MIGRLLFCARLALLTLGLHAACPAQGEARPESERPESKPPAPPVSDEASRLQAVVDEVRRYVERETNLEFEKAPEVLSPKFDEWSAIVKREGAETEDSRGGPSAAETIMGLFLLKDGAVALSPLVSHKLGRERKRGDRLAPGGVVLAHELTHALQEAHFGLVTKFRKKEEDKKRRFVLKSLIEGHALMIEERIAQKECGVTDYYEKSQRRLRGKLPYTAGRTYLLHIELREGQAGVNRKLESPPTYAEFMKFAFRRLPKPVVAPEGEGEAKSESGRETGTERGTGQKEKEG